MLKKTHYRGTHRRHHWTLNTQHTHTEDPANIEGKWIVPAIEGYVNKKETLIDSKPFKFVLISRRKCQKAGTYSQHCGLDDNGNVANMVETEQIIYYDDEVYSFTQIRGSLPVFWTKEGEGIDVTRLPENFIDALTKHFDDLIGAYKNVIVFNLLSESNESEMKLSRAFEINEEIYAKNNSSQIQYVHFDLVAESAKSSVLMY